jgi:hypothetical protein
MGIMGATFRIVASWVPLITMGAAFRIVAL